MNNYQKIIKYFQALICLVLIASCNNQKVIIEEPKEEPIKEESVTTKGAISYLALGDSYTIGEGVAESDNWPNQLAAELEKQDIEFKAVTIIARTGWTTEDLLGAIYNSAVEKQDLVSLSIGVNNQFQGQDFEKFKTEFNKLLKQAIDIAGTSKRVFVVSIPDYGVTPFGSSDSERIGKELDEYNQYKLERCKELNIPFINITEISRNLADGPDALAPDKLHPSARQYSEWVKEILPKAMELLNE